MKLVCINNIHHEDRLTIGKIYEFIKITNVDDSDWNPTYTYLMTDDNGDGWPFVFNGPNKFSRDRWISLEEYREQQIDKIL